MSLVFSYFLPHCSSGFPFSKGQKMSLINFTFQPHIESYWHLKWNEVVQPLGPVEKAWRGCPHVVMSFLNLGPHETIRIPIVQSQHPVDPWPLTCRWLTGSLQPDFPNLTRPLRPPPPTAPVLSGKHKLFSFMSRRRTSMIFQMNFTKGCGTGRGRNNRRVYGQAGCDSINVLANHIVGTKDTLPMKWPSLGLEEKSTSRLKPTSMLVLWCLALIPVQAFP